LNSESVGENIGKTVVKVESCTFSTAIITFISGDALKKGENIPQPPCHT